MAFKMTPGMKGNPAAKRVAGLGACGGPGQPPCPPRFQQEVTEARLQDRKSNRFVKAKAKAAVVAPKPQPKPPKLKINLPEGYKFGSKMAEAIFYEKFSDLSGFKSQEELDAAIAEQLKGGGPKDPKEPEGPVIGKPVLEGPVVVEPVKGVDVIKK